MKIIALVLVSLTISLLAVLVYELIRLEKSRKR